MRNHQWLTVGMLTLFTSACAVGDEHPVGTAASFQREPQEDALPTRPSEGHEGDEYLFDISREVPSYGGHLQTRSGNFIVFSTDSNDFRAARLALLARISNRRIYTPIDKAPPSVTAVMADYSIRQLAVWRDSIMAARHVFPWRMIDLDEGKNRVSIGVVPGTDYSENSIFAREASQRGIPLAALNVMPMGERETTSARAKSVLTATHLRGYADSLAGGYMYVWNNFGEWKQCTIGFAVNVSDGTKGFISAAHCSQSKWQSDSTSLRQPYPDITPRVGREIWDAPPGTCPFFWSCNHYRFSDTNLNWVDTTARKVKVGFLARPSTRNLNSGSDTTLASGNPYLQLVGETSSIVQGSDIDQIGSTSGWTYSEVLHTCVTWDNAVWPFNGQALRCSYIVEADYEGGDSGGPVFYYSGGTATAAGIMAAKTTFPFHRGVFSKFMYVRSDVQASGLTFSIMPSGTPPAYYPWYASISGAATIQPNASCHYMSFSNLEYTSIQWKADGVVIGTNWDVYHSSSTSFLLEVEVTDGTQVAFGSKLVTVSSEAGTCYDQ